MFTSSTSCNLATRIMVGAALFSGKLLAEGDDRTWKASGRITDGHGNPVAGVNVSTFWNANGIPPDSKLHRQFIRDDMSRREGWMEPMGHRTTTDADGVFELELLRNRVRLLAIDKERRHGAVIILDPKNRKAPFKTTLRPLVRVFGKVQAKNRDQPLPWTGVLLLAPFIEQYPLSNERLCVCLSLESRFEFLAPPGNYTLHAYNDDTPNLQTVVNVPVKPGLSELDVGVLELAPKPDLAELTAQSKSLGKWGDYTKHYGRRPPKWFISDALGVPRNVTISDFAGKWVLVYFWSVDCFPCLAKGIPELLDFNETHAKHRDEFEILTMCLDKEGQFTSVQQLERHLQPIASNVWNIERLPFPLLLDSSFRTYESFGLAGVGDLLLIDPSGNLVRGDAKTLAKELAKN